MKTSKALTIIALIAILFIANISAFGQISSVDWKISPANAKVFIENKGQFNNDAVDGQVLYAYDNGSTVIYFSKSGSTYAFIKKWPKEKDQFKEEEKFSTIEEWKEKEAEEKEMNFQTDFTGFTWENSNPDVQIIASEPCSDYYSYSIKDKSGKVSNINHINAFKKLTYKNLYPNIDVEYTFHPESGIKYALILHPGADVSKVKMKYTESPILKEDGSIHFPTLFGDIVEHTPQTFYKDNPLNMVGSQFRTSGQNVSFELSPYDLAQTVVIDPWVQTPTLPNSNGVWECERDGNDNVYITGGDMALKLLKYNSVGTLQWTYVTPWDTSNAWLGTMATDLAGNTYVTNGSDAQLEKINTSGGMIYHVNGGAFDEYWNIAFNNAQNKLVIGGTKLALPIQNSHGVIFDIDANTGGVNSFQNVGNICVFSVFGIPVTDPNEVRSVTAASNGRYYYLTLDSLGSITESFSSCGDLIKIPHTYSFGYKAETFRPNNGNSGIMAIRASQNFLYSQNGSIIHKRDLNTGNVLAAAAIPGGVTSTIPLMTPTAYQADNCGIAIDDCGNVYAGSSTGVIKYDPDLNIISTYTTSYKVFDVAINSNGNVIICGATGDNSQTTPRTGYIESVNMAACQPMNLVNCDANICPVAPICSTDPAFTLTPSVPGGTWSGAGITDVNLGIFDPAIAGVGNITVYYTMPCGTDSIVIVVNNCAPLIVCQETNGDISVSGGTGPYDWSVYVNPTTVYVTDAATCATCGGTWYFSFCLSGFTPIDSCTTPGYWSVFATGSTITPPGFPLQVSDGSSNSIIVVNMASLPLCGSCPTITVSTSGAMNVSCNGYSDGGFIVDASGGASPYDYVLWLSGVPVDTIMDATGSESFIGLPAGVYTIYANDANDCPGNTTITISEPSAFSPNINGILSFCTGGSSVLDAGAGYASYSWSTTETSQTITVSTSGTYSVTVTDANGCPGTNSAIVTVNSASDATITSTGPYCILDGAVNLTAVDPGGTWSGTGITNASMGTFNPATAGLGSHQIIYSISGSCGDADTAIITVVSVYNATINPAGPFCTSDASYNMTAVDPGGMWSGIGITDASLGTFSPLLAGVGIQTITYFIPGNCGDTGTIQVEVFKGQSVTGITSDESCDGANDGSIIISVSNGTPPYVINWSTSSQTTEIDSLAPGTYLVVVTDSLGCSVTQNFDVLPSATLCYEPVIYVPNVFSPNGDGINDILYVHGQGIETMTFIIYDRWGEKVFESTDPTKGWDGSFRGKQVENGVYVYYLKAHIVTDEDVKYKGNITIVR